MISRKNNLLSIFRQSNSIRSKQSLLQQLGSLSIIKSNAAPVKLKEQLKVLTHVKVVSEIELVLSNSNQIVDPM